MDKTNLLQKLTPVGVAAFGVIAFTGITVYPAQAGQLGYEDGTSEIFDLFVPVPAVPIPGGGTLSRPEPVGGVGDIVTITFSPDVSKFPPDDGIGQASISAATDEFVGTGLFTSAPPLYFADVIPAVATLEYQGPEPNEPFIGLYTLVDDLVLDFPNNGTEITYGAGSVFFIEYDFATTGDDFTIEGIEGEIEFISTTGTQVEIGSTIYRINDPDFFPITGLTLTFDEPAQGIAGEYSGGTTVSSMVPEPTTILGLLTIGGLGLGLKRKNQSIGMN